MTKLKSSSNSKHSQVCSNGDERAIAISPAIAQNNAPTMNAIELTQNPSASLRGFLKGIDTTVPRETDRA